MKATYQQQQQQHIITQLIEDCNNEHNLDRRIEMLYHINSILAKQHQLKIPSLITNAYINTALYRIEETFCLL
jgi:hypothetical protein